MYSVTVETTTSSVPLGASISSTKKLHEFLCSMDFQMVTKLEVKYFRELKSPHDVTVAVSTGSNSVVSLISNGPDSWEVSVPKPTNRSFVSP